ncbi:FUSC family protein [Tomitella gaofuii]|uniref:FUSC family protein n=1 Tax=Tomitella gaofuii TaxID=2760083 RepID=UPI001F18819D|nr:FUSC family protein [Tomitella gaofuii]
MPDVMTVVDYTQARLRTLAVSDPGRLRLRKAATVAISAALAMAVLILVTTSYDEPITVALLGTVIAVQAAAAVKDSTQRARVTTTLLIPFPAAAAVTLATGLLTVDPLAEIGFIAVLFCAVWVRRWGPRGEALGMVAFIAYFFSLFLHSTVDDIAMFCVAIIVGAACTLLIRVVVLPERPRLEIRRLARALRAASIEAVDAASDRAHCDLGRLRGRLDGLGETALMIEDWIDRHEGAELVSVTGRSFSVMVFDAQIATEQLASALWNLDPQVRWPSGLERATVALGVVLHDRPTAEELRAAADVASAAAREADASDPAGIATLVAHRAVQAHIAIHRITVRAALLFGPPAWLPARGARRAHGATSTDDRGPGGGEAVPGRDQSAGQSAPAPSAGAPAEGAGGSARTLAGRAAGWQPSTRAAIQVAVATSAATLLGELVSPDRWYWAVLTAFLVFNGASTRGEILSRAGHRIVGTVAGVVAGVVIAALVGHNPPVQMVLIIVCIFFAFYFAPVAYALLTFCVTVLLAMLYGLLGVFSIEVLGLRIAETAVGAVVGLASAYFILATSTQGELEAKTVDYLAQLDKVIAEAVASVAVPGTGHGIVESTRVLDGALQDVLKAAEPLRLRPAVRSRRSVRRFTRALTVINRAAHQLARAGVMATRADASTAPGAETVRELRAAAESVRERVELVRRSATGRKIKRPERDAEVPVLAVMLSATHAPGALRLSLRSLSKLNRALFEALS